MRIPHELLDSKPKYFIKKSQRYLTVREFMKIMEQKYKKIMKPRTAVWKISYAKNILSIISDAKAV